MVVGFEITKALCRESQAGSHKADLVWILCINCNTKAHGKHSTGPEENNLWDMMETGLTCDIRVKCVRYP